MRTLALGCVFLALSVVACSSSDDNSEATGGLGSDAGSPGADTGVPSQGTGGPAQGSGSRTEDPGTRAEGGTPGRGGDPDGSAGDWLPTQPEPGSGGSSGGREGSLPGPAGGNGQAGARGAACEYQGRTYQDGESWSCDCNTCGCMNGSVSSTRMYCGPDPGQAGSGGAAAGATGGAPAEGSCTPESGCDAGAYCELEPGSCAGSGTCLAMPQACELDYDPVCGCDQQTYGNACAAASAGVNVASTGECATQTGKGCGARLGDTCTANEYCDYQPGAYCGAADATATCKLRPAGCLEDYRPVCGCDGITYSNACSANSAGTGISSEGECPALDIRAQQPHADAQPGLSASPAQVD